MYICMYICVCIYVYKAKVTSNNENYQEKVYFGSCETTLKNDFQITKSHLI